MNEINPIDLLYKEWDHYVMLPDTARFAEEKITVPDNCAHKPWMKFAGALADFHEENVRIAKMIEEEFERIEPEDLA